MDRFPQLPTVAGILKGGAIGGETAAHRIVDACRSAEEIDGGHGDRGPDIDDVEMENAAGALRLALAHALDGKS